MDACSVNPSVPGHKGGVDYCVYHGSRSDVSEPPHLQNNQNQQTAGLATMRETAEVVDM